MAQLDSRLRQTHQTGSALGLRVCSPHSCAPAQLLKELHSHALSNPSPDKFYTCVQGAREPSLRLLDSGMMFRTLLPASIVINCCQWGAAQLFSSGSIDKRPLATTILQAPKRSVHERVWAVSLQIRSVLCRPREACSNQKRVRGPASRKDLRNLIGSDPAPRFSDGQGRAY